MIMTEHPPFMLSGTHVRDISDCAAACNIHELWTPHWLRSQVRCVLREQVLRPQPSPLPASLSERLTGRYRKQGETFVVVRKQVMTIVILPIGKE